MSTNSLFTIQMSFPFSFRLSVPGISNPFSSCLPPPGPALIQSETNRIEKQPPEAASANINAWALPAPVYRHRPSPGPAPPPLVRKRGWVPASAEPSRPAIVSASSSGFLNTSPMYTELAAAQHEEESNEEVVVDLPPSKRRKGITGSVISSAFSAALVGAAVGLTVYRMWRDRGKEPEQQPPPPYEEEWVSTRRPLTPPEPGPAQLGPQDLQRGRTNPSSHKRQAGNVRLRHKTVRRTVRATRDVVPKKSTPQIERHFLQEDVEPDDSKDEMDWIGDKLAQLIEEGKRALGKEIVIASEAPEDEIDDGSENWVEDEPQASTSFVSYPSRSTGFSSPSKRAHHTGSHSVSVTSPGRPTFALHSCFNSDGMLSASLPSTPDQSMSFAPESDMAASFSPSLRNTENEWSSPHIQESMERARAAYRQKRGLQGF